MSDYVWEPPAELVERANVTRLARRLGVETYDELQALSVRDMDRFWAEVVDDLGLPFAAPWERVRDSSRGVPWTRWFVGARLNVATACAERWADDPAHRSSPAVLWEDEEGATRTLDYGELARRTSQLSEGLEALGIGEGDAVGVLMPMTPEVVIAFLAIAALGAVSVPIFSGFSAPAVASRLQDARAVALLTVDGFVRRGRTVEAKRMADEAARSCPTLRHVVVLRHRGNDVAWRAERDVWWHDLVAGRPGERRATPVDAEHLLMLAYTSGTTGRPKGAVHVHGGFLAKIASETAYTGDARAGDRLHWVTDMGWIMGPWLVVGGLALGATILLYDGAPDAPDAGRVWRLAAHHRLTFLGVSPTLVRALRQHGDDLLADVDLSALRTFGSTGEPWNPEPYMWLFETVGGGLRPIMNISGGTEVGAGFLGAAPVLRHKPCSLGRPMLGMAMDVYDPDGRPLRGEVGELVCTAPWPGMTRGIWGDDERYLDAYWRRFEGVWTHGDWASVDGDGDWFLHGRSDDTLNVAGKRVGPAEYESALVADPDVAEACAIGTPHPVKGEVVRCYVVLTPRASPSEELRERLRGRCSAALGKAFAPEDVRFARMLPKTRSAKIVRRAVRAVALGQDPGDVSTLEDAAALDEIARAT